MSKLYVHPVTGNVGIGTDKPEGILDIKSVITNAMFPPPGMSNVVAVPDYTNMVDSIDVGNMPTLVEYPPPLHLGAQAIVDATVGSVTQGTITVSGSTYGSGAYVALASTQHNTNYPPAKAFNKLFANSTGYDAWYSVVTAYSNNLYVGSTSTLASSVPLLGEWLQLKTPSSICLKSYTLTSHSGPQGIVSMPSTFWVVGSNDGSAWTILDEQLNIKWITVQSKSFTLSSNDLIFNYYRIIISTLTNIPGLTLYATIGEWQLSADVSYATIREFPPCSMTGPAIDHLAMYGSGRYIASASSEYYISGNSYQFAYYSFDKSASATWPNNLWSSTTVYNAANGSYTGLNTTTTVSGTSYAGEWLQIQIPFPISFSYYTILPRADQSQHEAPNSFRVFGSLTGKDFSWTLIDTRSSLTWTAAAVTFTPSTSSSMYSYFRIVISICGSPTLAVANPRGVQIAEWKLFGSLNQKYPKLTLPLFNSQSTYGSGSYKAFVNTVYNPGTLIVGNSTNAIDANPSTYWRTGSNLYTSAIDASPAPTVYFEFPDGLKATSYALTARENAVFDEAPGKWSLYGSNMAAPGSWALLDARANISTWATENPKSFALTGNTTFYNAYKLEVLRNNSASGNFITIRDVQWIGDKQTPDTKLMITTGGRIGMNALSSSEYMLNVDGNIRANGDIMAIGYVMGLPKFANIQDRKPYNVNAGGSVALTWLVRDFNTITTDSIGITLHNNRITIPMGTYIITVSAPSFSSLRSQIRLRNVTQNTTIAVGRNAYTTNNVGFAVNVLECFITELQSLTIEVQQFSEGQSAENGLGVNMVMTGEQSIYSDLKIIKYG